MPAQIADLWTPEKWAQAVRERAAQSPGLLSRQLGVVKYDTQFDLAASGPGETAAVTAWTDQSDVDDAEQVEDTAPADGTEQGGVTLTAPILSRVTASSFTAAALEVALADTQERSQEPPALASIVQRRLMQRQRTLVSILRGCFGSAFQSAPNAALSSLRYDYFSEDPGETVAEDYQLPLARWIDGKAALGELESQVAVFFCHPTIAAEMERRDKDDGGGTTREPLIQNGRILGARIIPSNDLVRDGGTSGKVFDSYLLTRSCFAHGEQPQLATKQAADPYALSVASLAIEKVPP
jgi:hypothetical protein